MNRKIYNTIVDNVKTILYALVIAILIRSLLYQPFYIPSSSMEPTLLVGDRLFVSKFTYGYSRHSFPFSPTKTDRILYSKKPKRGDLIVFKTPADNRTDYIKRLIGLPGDTIQFIDGNIFLNDTAIKRKLLNNKIEVRCGNQNLLVKTYEETLPEGINYIAAYNSLGTLMNTDKYKVPNNHFFFLGDNRDCSKDSRFLSSVGYVQKNNLVGKAEIIFFSNDTIKNSLFKFWKLKESFRLKRTFKKL